MLTLSFDLDPFSMDIHICSSMLTWHPQMEIPLGSVLCFLLLLFFFCFTKNEIDIKKFEQVKCICRELAIYADSFRLQHKNIPSRHIWGTKMEYSKTFCNFCTSSVIKLCVSIFRDQKKITFNWIMMNERNMHGFCCGNTTNSIFQRHLYRELC